MNEEQSERKSMSEKERREMEEQEKTSEVWATEKEERIEKASGDISEGHEKTTVNPPSGGGKILKGTHGETAAGAKCGYPSKPCNR
jgi:hypothetical protein